MKYKVVKISRKMGRKTTLASHLSLNEAKKIVNSFPNNEKYMVVFYKEEL